MKKWAYYNDVDPYVCEWVRNLIKHGHIAPGIVDERSIEDIYPDDLREFCHVHMFCGIAGWAYALDLAGWPRDRPVWTGSCPCQPFSAAGKGDGFEDERHLWPAWQHLIAQCRPPVVFGEQVASKAADRWIDLVHADLEGMGYAFGCVPFPSASVGAPHIRDRTYWLGYADDARSQGHAGNGGAARREGPRGPVAASGVSVRLADDDGFGLEPQTSNELQTDTQHHAQPRGGAVRVADTNGAVAELSSWSRTRPDETQGARTRGEPDGCGELRTGQSSQVNGFWRDADWLFCRDGKWRPVEPATFPLAHGVPGRVGRLRGYGNAINAEAAKVFIQSYLEARGEFA